MEIAIKSNTQTTKVVPVPKSGRINVYKLIAALCMLVSAAISIAFIWWVLS